MSIITNRGVTLTGLSLEALIMDCDKLKEDRLLPVDRRLPVCELLSDLVAGGSEASEFFYNSKTKIII